MKRFVFALVVCFLVPTLGAAQSPATSYVAKYYQQGATAPVQSETFQVAATVCNLVAPPATASTVNPTKLVWDDPTNVGKVCQFVEPTSGPLFSVPLGTYEATLTAVNSAGSSAESNRAPFSKVAAPGTPVNLKAVQ